MDRKIKVLILDDSLFFREFLSRGISTDSNIEVVAKAVDPFDARDKILKFKPDVVTCDIEMPKMNGIEFIKRLLPQYPLPVIVISAISDAVFDALKAGAVDFVTKPNLQALKNTQEFTYDLIRKIKVVANAKVMQDLNIADENISISKNLNLEKVIAIGASTGGTEAIANILKQLPKKMPGILIVQHIPPVFSRMFAERLNNQTLFTVKEAEQGDYLEPGKVLIAPGDQHISVKKAGNRYKLQLSYGEKVNGHCPSVDVLFESVAKECGNSAIGIILTGMGYDGAKGLLAMRQKGARTIGQNEATSVVYGMPKVAFQIGAVEKQSSIENIPHVLYGMLR